MTRPPTADVVLASTLAVLAQTELWLPHALPGPPNLVQALTTVALTAPLAWRRRAPLAVGLGILMVFALQPLLATPPNLFAVVAAVVVSIFGIAAHSSTWPTAIAGGMLAVALSVVWAVFAPAPANEAVADAVFAALVWACGAIVRRHAGRVRDSRAEVARLHAESDERARALIAEERARIARELHDVVAHSIGVVVLQARGGRRVMDFDPDDARQAFTDIERLSTQSLDEMRRLLGVLRGQDDSPAHAVSAPQPGLRDLDQLVDRTRRAGLEVDIRVSGECRELPPGLDLSAYRIVQEALTNVLRHALGGHAKIQLDYTAAAVDIAIIDDGRAQPDPVPGHGLISMRERTELFGGTISCGPRPGGGFAVLAHLPVPSSVR